MKRDNLHFTWNKALSYNKIWNFATTSREAGKSTETALKIFNAYVREGRPSIIMKRRIADMTATFIEDFAKTINEWIPEDRKIQLVYMKGDLKSGTCDIKCCSADESPTYAEIKKMLNHQVQLIKDVVRAEGAKFSENALFDALTLMDLRYL